MKTGQIFKITLIASLILFFVTHESWSQDESDPNNGKHEIKVNGLYILLEAFEFSYDHILGEQSSVGVSIGFTFDDDLGYDFMVVPNYKLFFNEKKAAGFYIELNSAVVNDESEVDFGMGIAIGGKFLNRNNFIGEIVLGGGRYFSSDGGYPRLGISIGKRF